MVTTTFHFKSGLVCFAVIYHSIPWYTSNVQVYCFDTMIYCDILGRSWYITILGRYKYFSFTQCFPCLWACLDMPMGMSGYTIWQGLMLWYNSVRAFGPGVGDSKEESSYCNILVYTWYIDVFFWYITVWEYFPDFSLESPTPGPNAHTELYHSISPCQIVYPDMPIGMESIGWVYQSIF